MAEALIALALLALGGLVPVIVSDPVLRGAWITADAAALLAGAAGIPLSLGLWACAGHCSAIPRQVLGSLVAALAVGGLLAEPAILAQAALGVPVTVLALLACLRPLAPAGLRLAAANGVPPGAQVRFVVAPLMLPGLAGGGLIVFAAVLAGGLHGAPSALDWSLPVADMTAWMMWLLFARR